MKGFSLLLTSGFLLCASAGTRGADPPAAATITLKSTDGKSFEATVVSLGKDSVKVKRKDGKVFDVPLARLTPESIEDVKKAAPGSNDAPPPGKKPPVEKPTHPDQIETKFSVKAGEKVCVTFEVKGDGVEKVTLLNETDEKTPHFDVDVTRADDEHATASIHHTFPKTIRYRCLGRSKGSKSWHEYNMIPAPSNFWNGETWGAMEEIVLFGFKFTDEPRPK
jgi:hypothetical protein